MNLEKLKLAATLLERLKIVDDDIKVLTFFASRVASCDSNEKIVLNLKIESIYDVPPEKRTLIESIADLQREMERQIRPVGLFSMPLLETKPKEKKNLDNVLPNFPVKDTTTLEILGVILSDLEGKRQSILNEIEVLSNE